MEFAFKWQLFNYLDIIWAGKYTSIYALYYPIATSLLVSEPSVKVFEVWRIIPKPHKTLWSKQLVTHFSTRCIRFIKELINSELPFYQHQFLEVLQEASGRLRPLLGLLLFHLEWKKFSKKFRPFQISFQNEFIKKALVLLRHYLLYYIIRLELILLGRQFTWTVILLKGV